MSNAKLLSFCNLSQVIPQFNHTVNAALAPAICCSL